MTTTWAFGEGKFRNFVKRYRHQLLELGATDESLANITFEEVAVGVTPYLAIVTETVKSDGSAFWTLLELHMGNGRAKEVYDEMDISDQHDFWRYVELFLDVLNTK